MLEWGFPGLYGRSALPFFLSRFPPPSLALSSSLSLLYRSLLSLLRAHVHYSVALFNKDSGNSALLRILHTGWIGYLHLDTLKMVSIKVIAAGVVAMASLVSASDRHGHMALRHRYRRAPYGNNGTDVLYPTGTGVAGHASSTVDPAASVTIVPVEDDEDDYVTVTVTQTNTKYLTVTYTLGNGKAVTTTITKVRFSGLRWIDCC
jgi:hypothetical protein